MRIKGRKLGVLKRRYAKLVQKIISSNANLGVSTIYHFQKWCKYCGAGLKDPRTKHRVTESRLRRTLWRTSYCSEECKEMGPDKTQRMRARPTRPRRASFVAEDMALLAMEIKRAMQNINSVGDMVQDIDTRFATLAEKLSFLEMVTGVPWGKSKFYYYMGRDLPGK